MMNNSRIYFMEKIDTVVLQVICLLCHLMEKERSYYGWNQVVEKGGKFINLFLFYLIIEVCC